MHQVVIHTDGGCRQNPGLGSWAFVLETKVNGKVYKKQASQCYKLTTNNRMELMAVIFALKSLTQPCHVDFHSDSKYVIDGIQKNWAVNWKKKGWIKSDKKPAVNIDLWHELILEVAKHKITWHWVKGHSGNAGNELCDLMCNQAMDEAKNVKVDEYYISPAKPADFK
ncbi:ribonuclease HI [Marinicellulosiphila megalodicopiae]|uniref:ribonuclease HI n=1 Tax=Marinicellulosiphila megalodicopiae TaxID=2724896 RepID=UPI003BB18898